MLFNFDPSKPTVYKNFMPWFTKFDADRWRVCLWVSSIPAILLTLGMEYCAKSPHWLYKVLYLRLLSDVR